MQIPCVISDNMLKWLNISKKRVKYIFNYISHLYLIAELSYHYKTLLLIMAVIYLSGKNCVTVQENDLNIIMFSPEPYILRAI